MKRHPVATLFFKLDNAVEYALLVVMCCCDAVQKPTVVVTLAVRTVGVVYKLLGIGDDPGIIHWNSRGDVSEVCGAHDIKGIAQISGAQHFDGAKRELGDVSEDSYLVFYSFAVGFAHADCRW